MGETPLNPNSETPNPKPEIRNLKPDPRNPKPETRNPTPNFGIRNPKPETRNSKPERAIEWWSLIGWVWRGLGTGIVELSGIALLNRDREKEA